jgi:ketosteroid isomerase-like protein
VIAKQRKVGHVIAPDSAEAAVALRFNDSINARDLAGLSALMTDDHTFVDPAGERVEGKQACVEAWRGFFAAFPDYRNLFTGTTTDGDTVAITGYSECSVPELAGAARWTARVRDGKVAQWRVSDA